VELLDAIRRAKDPAVRQKLVEAYRRERLREAARDAEIHNWIMLLTARTGYPSDQADVDRAAAALASLHEGEEEAVRATVLDLVRRHVDWSRKWVDGIRARLREMGKDVEVPGPRVPF
jgi:hypothetical protein